MLIGQLAFEMRSLQARNQDAVGALQSKVETIHSDLRRIKQAAPQVRDQGKKAKMKSARHVEDIPVRSQQSSLANKLLLELAEQAGIIKNHMFECVVLRTDAFEEMGDRHAGIKTPHAATFEWVFEELTELPCLQHFVKWLVEGDGIFWISGKPGAGKSTLMKYIFHAQETMEALYKWAGSRRLIVAKFYFWASGSPIEKTVRGLLRALLYQMLQQCPHFISKAFPQYDSTNFKHLDINLVSILYEEELVRAIQTIASLCSEGDLDERFCFFIDGLDEYEGFDRDITALVEKFSANQAIKLCVASRPHNVFVSSFGQDATRTLRVQDYSDHDVKKFIHDQLLDNTTFRQCMSHDSAGYHRLADYIRREASGVFLWVRLVVLKVLDGVENADRMSDLQRKVETLPLELESLFALILNSVDSDYREEQAQMLSIACHSFTSLPLIAYSLLDDDDNFLAALHTGPTPMSNDDMESRCQYMRKRMNARCKLLLEVIETNENDHYFGLRVTFLHRTIRDYVESLDAQNVLARYLKKGFSPRLEVCKAVLAHIRCLPGESSRARVSWWAEDGPIAEILLESLLQLAIVSPSKTHQQEWLPLQ
jgi:hypothetical protein